MPAFGASPTTGVVTTLSTTGAAGDGDDCGITTGAAGAVVGTGAGASTFGVSTGFGAGVTTTTGASTFGVSTGAGAGVGVTTTTGAGLEVRGRVPTFLFWNFVSKQTSKQRVSRLLTRNHLNHRLQQERNYLLDVCIELELACRR